MLDAVFRSFAVLRWIINHLADALLMWMQLPLTNAFSLIWIFQFIEQFLSNSFSLSICIVSFYGLLASAFRCNPKKLCKNSFSLKTSVFQIKYPSFIIKKKGKSLEFLLCSLRSIKNKSTQVLLKKKLVNKNMSSALAYMKTLQDF